MIYTAESVTAWHPDKICDQISDAIVDACLEQDPLSRVAVETLGGHGTVVLIGEVTTRAIVDFSAIARRVYFELCNNEIGVLCNITRQSTDIAQGVDKGGAGDQGIMVGYACNENKMYIPNEMYYARKLLKGFTVDGKSQVTMTEDAIDSIILSVQGKTKTELEEHIKNFLAFEYFNVKTMYCNNTGAFEVGGFDSDSGCTGRKIVVDAYGPRIPVGGGAFSGKDPTKVDRSGAYMARWIALNLLKEKGAKEVEVEIAYVIGGVEPTMVTATIDGFQEKITKYDCRPLAIIERFNLRTPIYQDLAKNGHFGRELPWEKYAR